MTSSTPRRESLKYTDLFCGLGSFHFSMQNSSKALRVPSSCTLACDISEHVRNTYFMNYNIKPHGDIRKIKTIPKSDIVFAGFPCQSFSRAGNQLGLEDQEQGGLFRYIVPFFSKKLPKQPSFVILENVTAVIKHNNGKTFQYILNTIRKHNYNVQYFKIRCSDHGIPQMRKRLFIVAIHKRHPESWFQCFHNRISKPATKTPSLSTFLRSSLPKGHTFEKKVSYSIRCSAHGSQIEPTTHLSHNWDGYYVNTPTQKRAYEYRLSEDDCKKLQGFPKSYVIDGSKVHRSKQLGNSIPTPLTRVITDSIMMCYT